MSTRTTGNIVLPKRLTAESFSAPQTYQLRSEPHRTPVCSQQMPLSIIPKEASRPPVAALHKLRLQGSLISSSLPLTERSDRRPLMQAEMQCSQVGLMILRLHIRCPNILKPGAPPVTYHAIFGRNCRSRGPGPWIFYHTAVRVLKIRKYILLRLLTPLEHACIHMMARLHP